MTNSPSLPPTGGSVQGCGAPVKNLEDLNASPKLKSQALVDQAMRIEKNGWERWGVTLPSLRPPIPWEGNRGSFDYSLHAFEPLTILIPAFEHSQEQALYDLTVDMTADWLHQIQAPLLADPGASIAGILKTKQRSAWYDMAVGQRIYRLACVLDMVASRQPERAKLIETLYASMEFHHRLLAQDRFFAADSNHGIYQALGQMAAARRFETRLDQSSYLAISEARLKTLLSGHYFASGAHKEHSPGYQYMIMGSLTGALADDVVRNPELAGLIERMEHTLSWMLKPDMYLVTFGDSDPRHLKPDPRNADRMTDPALRFLMSGGIGGAAPEAGVHSCLDAGYAFARLYAPDVEPEFPNASYLAQIAGFHSRVHKHADHLSFVWYELQRDILIDPGRYAYVGKNPRLSKLFQQGFWYSDPKRVYVESTRAHNCVEIDGESYPRKDVKPFGSALVYAGEQGGLAVTVCELRHPGGIRHRRVLVMGPGRFLLTLDFLQDRLLHRNYRQWFQFAPEWQLERGPDGVSGLAPAADGRQAAGLRIFNLLDENRMGQPVRGQEEPQLQGWHSDAANSLKPSTSLAVEAANRKIGRFATLIALDDGARIDTGATRFNVTLRDGAVSWSDRHGRHVLAISTGEDGKVQVLMGGPELAASAEVRSAGNKGLKRGFLQRILHYLRP